MPVTEYVEGEGSSYTVRVEILDPSVHPTVETEGYRSRTPLFVVLNDGQVEADHDRHRLIRSLTGRNEWLHDHLLRLKDKAIERHERKFRG